MLKDLAASFLFPTELSAMLRLKFGGYVKKSPAEPLDVLAKTLNDVDFCYATLTKVSRSFAMVIQQLPNELKDPVCIFYLVLRGLDSVEDDMTVEASVKLPLLKTFYNKLMIDGWSVENVGDSPDYRILLAHFGKVISVFKSLDKKYQTIIMDITRRMGEGMAEFATKTGSIDNCTNYNLYCHYVAGLVGHGLSRLFSQSGLEDPELQFEERISNSMGLFLQKTNIIRDYLEDLEAGRTWWPEEIWKKYGKDLGHFAQHPYGEESLAALNHMVCDALAHVPDVLDYLGRLKDRKVFEFCAIPQVMAIATLADVYNNPLVFKGNVKIRKGLACKLMLEASSLYQVHTWFHYFAVQMENLMPANNDAMTKRTRELLEQTKLLCKPGVQTRGLPAGLMKACNLLAWALFFLASTYILFRLRLRSQLNPESDDSSQLTTWLMRPGVDLAAVFTAFASVGYLFGFFGIQYV